jgi:hypothetical protein
MAFCFSRVWFLVDPGGLPNVHFGFEIVAAARASNAPAVLQNEALAANFVMYFEHHRTLLLLVTTYARTGANLVYKSKTPPTKRFFSVSTYPGMARKGA